jgi:methionyl-tRNA formyltransferase
LPNMRIVFMGTPDFAVPTLKKLHASDHEVVLVVTQPDRPAGRGRNLRSPPVKDVALSLSLPVEQYESVNTDEFVAHLASLEPDVVVVVAFGQILRGDLLGVASFGSINVHASLLPRYRGVAPINWVIMNGETETGVTTMFMAPKVDAGEIIMSRKVAIRDMETAGDLYDRLADLGADLLIETLDLVEREEAPRVPQDAAVATYARKLCKSDGEIDWEQPAGAVFNKIRGTTPWPGAYTWFGGRLLRVLAAAPGEAGGVRGAPGEILGIDETAGVEVAAAEGSLWLTLLKPEGKRAMDGAAFARGYRPEIGSRPFRRDG